MNVCAASWMCRWSSTHVTRASAYSLARHRASPANPAPKSSPVFTPVALTATAFGEAVASALGIEAPPASASSFAVSPKNSAARNMGLVVQVVHGSDEVHVARGEIGSGFRAQQLVQLDFTRPSMAAHPAEVRDAEDTNASGGGLASVSRHAAVADPC